MTVWLADENFNDDIVAGLLLRISGVEIATARSEDLLGASDPEVLALAATQGRVLLTHDEETMPDFAYNRLAAREPMPGMVVVPWAMAIGRAIEELELVFSAARDSDLDGRVHWLPVRF